MRIKIIIFVAILVVCNTAYGQVTKDSYEKAVDYLNCKTVELSLKNDKNKDDYSNKFSCNENVSSENIIGYLEKNDITKTLELSKEIDGIKKSFKEDWKSDDAANFLSEEVFNDKKYPKLEEFANKRNNDNFEEFKRKLKDNLNKYLSVSQVSPTPAPSVSSSPIIDKPEERGLNYAFWIPIIGFLILAAGLIISFRYLHGELKTLNHDLQSKMYGYVDRKLSNTPKTSASPITSLNSSEIVKSENRIGELENKTTHLASRIESLENRNDKRTDNPVRQDWQPRTGSDLSIEIFYLSTPNKDGSFNEKSAHSSYKESASIYKFTKTIYGDAEFQIDESESSIKLALEYPEKNIDPVCDAENAFNPKASQIITVKLGKAELDGDKWKVIRKAIIRYEH